MKGAPHPDIAAAQAEMKKAPAEMAAAKAEMQKAQAKMAAKRRSPRRHLMRAQCRRAAKTSRRWTWVIGSIVDRFPWPMTATRSATNSSRVRPALARCPRSRRSAGYQVPLMRYLVRRFGNLTMPADAACRKLWSKPMRRSLISTTDTCSEPGCSRSPTASRFRTTAGPPIQPRTSPYASPSGDWGRRSIHSKGLRKTASMGNSTPEPVARSIHRVMDALCGGDVNAGDCRRPGKIPRFRQNAPLSRPGQTPG